MSWKMQVSRAAAVLVLFVVASWLPARAAHGTDAASGPNVDLSRPALPAPRVSPAVPPNGLAATRDYLFALAEAVVSQVPSSSSKSSSASEAQDAVLSGLAGAAFVRAYGYLDQAWRSRVPFSMFTGQWSGVRRMDVLAVLPAGSPSGARTAQRAFAEVRLFADTPRPVIVLAYGTFLAAPERGGYFLTSGSLHDEPHLPSGTNPPSPSAVAQAVVAAANPGTEPTAGLARSGAQPHTVTVTVSIGPTTAPTIVQLYQLVNGQWVVIQTQR